MNVRDVLLVTYGEPPNPSFGAQLRYSWRILLGLTRSVAPIPAWAVPLIALSRARLRVKMWKDEAYASPLEPLTVAQADALAAALRGSDPTTEWRVHVAYEFRDPLLPDLLDGLVGDDPVLVVPMYLTDSAFTHELTRRCVERSVSRGGYRAARVLPALNEDALAEVSASHILRELDARGIVPGPDTALVLAAHGTLLDPPRPIETGRRATERIAAGIESRLGSRFGRVTLGWLNHVYGGRWTQPPADVALRDIARAGLRRVVYFPFGFLADNAESQLEGRIALRAAPELGATHLPCLNADAGFIAALAIQILAGTEFGRRREPSVAPEARPQALLNG